MCGACAVMRSACAPHVRYYAGACTGLCGMSGTVLGMRGHVRGRFGDRRAGHVRVCVCVHTMGRGKKEEGG